MTVTNEKYIYKANKKYIIRKYDKFLRRLINYGVYNSLKDAIEIRNFLIRHDWSLIYSKTNNMKFKNYTTRYIYKRNNKYIVRKWIKGKYIWFGSFNTVDDAIKQRDKLECNNWKKEKQEVI